MGSAKRIYIAGCGGMLGEAFHRMFSADCELRCTDIDVNEPWLSHLDFRNWDAYRREVRGFKPDWLFHLGAHTSLEYCEMHPDDAYATNTLAVENAVHLANELDIPVLYIGTAGVFDGVKGCYDDWDVPNPLGHYARSKCEGERYVAAHARRFLVCRAGWMMGAGPEKDKKFIRKIFDQLKAGQRDLRVVTDKLGTPTYTRDFAANVKLLLDTGLWGIYNLVCEGETSRMEVAAEFVRLLGMADAVRIRPVDSSYFQKDYFAPRPASERLINRKLNLRGLNRMRHWKTALAEYVAEFYAGRL